MIPDPQTEGRFLALRKALAFVLAEMPPQKAAETLSAVLLPVGEEDPGVLATEVDPMTAAMGTELSAILEEADRYRRGYA